MEPERFWFGRFEFDAARLELRHEGALVHLQSQPAQVLAVLIKSADEIVSREELRQAVWGDKTFVDFEGGLNFCISQLRSALQDNSARSAYIQTVPKRGYRFIAPVQRIFTPKPEQSGIEDAKRWTFDKRKATLALALGSLAAIALFGYRFRSVHSVSRVPILAVLRFDSEPPAPGFTQFSDALTDNVVEQLTSQSRGDYRVIGNAQILRLAREQRDLKVIASSLHAEYVVLGQVQTNGTRVRILAHLIRLSDQTHIWVVRVDRPLTDALSLQSEAASKIAAEFSARMSADPSQATSFPSASH